MSIRLRPRARLVVGCTVAFGCLFIPQQYSSSLSLTCVSAFAPAQKVMARAGRSLGSGLGALWTRGGSATGKRKLEAIYKSGTEVGTACFWTSATTFVGFVAMTFVPVPAFQQLGLVLGLGLLFH